MADEDALRDANRRAVLIGVNSSGDTRRALVDGVTGYLLMRLAGTSVPAALSTSVAPRDANNVPTAMCVTAAGAIRAPLATSDGYLYVNSA